MDKIIEGKTNNADSEQFDYE